MLVEITQKGMDHWDNNRSKTEFAEQISVRGSASKADQGLFVLGLLYGAGADDPTPLVRTNPKWIRVIQDLVDDGYLRIVEVEEAS